MKTISIYWTCSEKAKERICDVLKIQRYTNVNGETTLNNNKILADLEDLQRRGFIKLRVRNL